MHRSVHLLWKKCIVSIFFCTSTKRCTVRYALLLFELNIHFVTAANRESHRESFFFVFFYPGLESFRSTSTYNSFFFFLSKFESVRSRCLWTSGRTLSFFYFLKIHKLEANVYELQVQLVFFQVRKSETKVYRLQNNITVIFHSLSSKLESQKQCSMNFKYNLVFFI